MTAYDIEYKVGDTDNIGTILKHNGVAVNLTGFTVEFIMKSDAGTRITVPCTLGGDVNGTPVAGASGGITAHFTSTSTATAGTYSGEFVASWSATESIRFPSGNNYVSVKIWEAI